jgi:hypothetical protein
LKKRLKHSKPTAQSPATRQRVPTAPTAPVPELPLPELPVPELPVPAVACGMGAALQDAAKKIPKTTAETLDRYCIGACPPLHIELISRFGRAEHVLRRAVRPRMQRLSGPTGPAQNRGHLRIATLRCSRRLAGVSFQ